MHNKDKNMRYKSTDNDMETNSVSLYTAADQ